MYRTSLGVDCRVGYDRVSKLLKDAGRKDGFALVLVVPGGDNRPGLSPLFFSFLSFLSLSFSL